MTGGLGFRVEQKDGWWEAQPVLCFIDRRLVSVVEARFGGIVAEPVRDVPQDLGPHGIDVTRRGWVSAAKDFWREG